MSDSPPTSTSTTIPTVPVNQSLKLYNSTVEIVSIVHGEGRSGSGTLVRIDGEVFVATCFHVIGRFLEDGTPAFRENVIIRHIATETIIAFGSAAGLEVAFYEDGSFNCNLDAVLVELPEDNDSYLEYALFVQDCSFAEVMGQVVRGYGCKKGKAKFFSGELSSQLADHTFCVSSNSTEKGLSGSACTIENICVGIVQGGTSGEDDRVYVPPRQTVRTLAGFATDSLVTKLFHHARLTYIVSSSVLLRIHAGLHQHAEPLKILVPDTVEIHQTNETISTSDEDEGKDFNVTTRFARRRSSGRGEVAAAPGPVVPAAPGPVVPVVHQHITQYSCCKMS